MISSESAVKKRSGVQFVNSQQYVFEKEDRMYELITASKIVADWRNVESAAGIAVIDYAREISGCDDEIPIVAINDVFPDNTDDIEDCIVIGYPKYEKSFSRPADYLSYDYREIKRSVNHLDPAHITEENQKPYAGFGLLWKRYGVSIMRATILENLRRDKFECLEDYAQEIRDIDKIENLAYEAAKNFDIHIGYHIDLFTCGSADSSPTWIKSFTQLIDLGAKGRINATQELCLSIVSIAIRSGIMFYASLATDEYENPIRCMCSRVAGLPFIVLRKYTKINYAHLRALNPMLSYVIYPSSENILRSGGSVEDDWIVQAIYDGDSPIHPFRRYKGNRNIGDSSYDYYGVKYINQKGNMMIVNGMENGIRNVLFNRVYSDASMTQEKIDSICNTINHQAEDIANSLFQFGRVTTE